MTDPFLGAEIPYGWRFIHKSRVTNTLGDFAAVGSRVGPCYLLAFASRHWYYFACWLKTKSFNFLFDWVRKALQVKSFPCNANISRNPINDVSWQFGQFIWDSLADPLSKHGRQQTADHRKKHLYRINL